MTGRAIYIHTDESGDEYTPVREISVQVTYYATRYDHGRHGWPDEWYPPEGGLDVEDDDMQVVAVDKRPVSGDEAKVLTDWFNALYASDAKVRQWVRDACERDSANLEPPDRGEDDYPENYFSRMARLGVRGESHADL